ncbi:uncharacterized protein B0I36DRAFT_350538 [Microdochium trichocladiopsis]|uniref:Uncharacterized protein n=1 Tax=Microdochium trichocladiopsis TaxID=1682393 RepID=A0A9P9BQ08_9PEZI|nr:uncharacterized protein B0I36DRAFT_350538 [Microdochium trichocladiopsis]KAH7029710.1 hypothetical protein B0I36DRAFT_350538 [Microdochium trichocladiopsis]
MHISQNPDHLWDCDGGARLQPTSLSWLYRNRGKRCSYALPSVSSSQESSLRHKVVSYDIVFAGSYQWTEQRNFACSTAVTLASLLTLCVGSRCLLTPSSFVSRTGQLSQNPGRIPAHPSSALTPYCTRTSLADEAARTTAARVFFAYGSILVSGCSPHGRERRTPCCGCTVASTLVVLGMAVVVESKKTQWGLDRTRALVTIPVHVFRPWFVGACRQAFRASWVGLADPQRLILVHPRHWPRPVAPSPITDLDPDLAPVAGLGPPGQANPPTRLSVTWPWRYHRCGWLDRAAARLWLVRRARYFPPAPRHTKSRICPVRPAPGHGPCGARGQHIAAAREATRKLRTPVYRSSLTRDIGQISRSLVQRRDHKSAAVLASFVILRTCPFLKPVPRRPAYSLDHGVPSGTLHHLVAADIELNMGFAVGQPGCKVDVFLVDLCPDVPGRQEALHLEKASYKATVAADWYV